MLVLLYLFLPLLASRVEAVDKVEQEAFDQGTLVLLGGVAVLLNVLWIRIRLDLDVLAGRIRIRNDFKR
jgi:hypothetical protein